MKLRLKHFCECGKGFTKGKNLAMHLAMLRHQPKKPIKGGSHGPRSVPTTAVR